MMLSCSILGFEEKESRTKMAWVLDEWLFSHSYLSSTIPTRYQL
jgi:hypothetical protein